MTDEFDSQLGEDILDATTNQTYESDIVTLSGVVSPTQAQIDDPNITALISYIDHEFSEIRYRSSSTEDFSQYYTKQQLIDLGLTNVNGVQTGWQFQLRITAPSSASTIRVAYVAVIDNRNVAGRATFGQVLLKTASSTTAGQEDTITTGTATNFGLEIRNEANITIFGQNLRQSHIVTEGQILSLAGGATSTIFPVEGLTVGNTDEFAIIVNTSSDILEDAIPATINRFGGYFSITNNLTTTINTIDFRVLRY